MNPIYKPKGKAEEYADLALNIDTGCSHGCTYCYAPLVLHKDREIYHQSAEPRKGILEATKRQIERERITGQTIFLCFSCDPYPNGYDTTITREIIKLLKDTGNHVQILTKDCITRDFDLLDGDDWFGVTISCYKPELVEKAEPNAAPVMKRIQALHAARDHGIKTWVSFEPVLDAEDVLNLLKTETTINKVKIGKMNYFPSEIDWSAFGHKAAELCRENKLDYYIKEGLRKEMEADQRRCCVTCYWHQHENWSDGWVCVNDQSDRCCEWVQERDACPYWEKFSRE